MKKVLVMLFILILLTICFCINVFAADSWDASVTKSFTLSKKDLTVSGYSYNYTSGNATVNTYVQHWKGNIANRDTARTQISSSTNLGERKCTVTIYVDGKVNISVNDPLYAETPTASIWQTVSRTYHKIETTSYNGKTYLYEATGNP